MKIGQLTINTGRTAIMGILNATPDSFSDGGKFTDVDAAMRQIESMIADGADIIDLGAESTRPGADPVTADDEILRLQPILDGCKRHFDTPVSIDTSKSAVAKAVLEVGADMINDVTGLKGDPEMAGVVAKAKVPICVMHMKGTPRTMQSDPHYDDVVAEVKTALSESVQVAKDVGIQDVIVDPGIGFGKTVDHNLKLLANLAELKSLRCPILIGTSRKSFIEAVTGAKIDERVPGTIASNAAAVLNGAAIVRVHDVAEALQSMAIVDAIREAA